MEMTKGFTDKNEYGLCVENIAIRLLVNKDRVSFGTTLSKDMYHTHSFTELFVCFSDEICIQTEQGLLRLPKNSAAVIPADVPHHKIEADDENCWDSVGFIITEKPKRGCHNLYGSLKPLYEDPEPSVFYNVPEIARTVEALHRVFPKSAEYLPALEWVCALSKLALKKTQKTYSKNKPPIRTPDVYRMACLEELLQNRFYEPLTAGMVARQLNISTRQFSRIIKERTGMTFHKVLVKKRLECAAELLLKTNQSVNSILKKVGYENSSLFYKEFAAQFGTTPTEYRLTAAGENLQNIV